MKSEREVAQSCLTLSDAMDCSLADSSVHGIFQARVLEWGAIAFSEPPPKPGPSLQSHPRGTHPAQQPLESDLAFTLTFSFPMNSQTSSHYQISHLLSHPGSASSASLRPVHSSPSPLLLNWSRGPSSQPLAGFSASALALVLFCIQQSRVSFHCL